MAVRSGMEHLILKVREHTDTEENAVTVNGVVYWTDQQIQDRLDECVHELYDYRLTPDRRRYGAVWETRRFLIGDDVPPYFELPTEIDNRFEVIVNGVSLAWDAHTFTSELRLLTFPSGQPSTAMYVRGYAYNINKVCAGIWQTKAGHRSKLVRWKAGAQTVHEDQEYKHCIEQMEIFKRKSSIQVVALKGLGYGTGH